MELRSRVLAEVESGDMSLGVSTFSTLLTEGSGELVPVCVVSSSSVEEIAVAWASPSHQDAEVLGLAIVLRAPIASSPQMSGLAGAKIKTECTIRDRNRNGCGTGFESACGYSHSPHSASSSSAGMGHL